MSGIVTWAEANTYLLVLILAVGTGIAVFLGFRQMAAFMVMATGLLLMRRVETDRQTGSRT